ncbi:hypothetical protein LG634_21030 [Streptomyces bambusae]|uniref:hypothetical protein n=1 Tax=Streptomyces bambusae TaxID=1550616 RepID=UPI001CFE563E|nr:hypothetical protein [Streptomyces bambusae]MCB5167313.1 hypothetical protein [Streptomyces bambusae]
MAAAIVGVIANLALYFAEHALFADVDEKVFGPVTLVVPDLGTLRPAALAITVVAALLIFRVRWSVLRTLGVCAVLGLGTALAGLPGI